MQIMTRSVMLLNLHWISEFIAPHTYTIYENRKLSFHEI